jgi:hypothetical protein
MHECRYKSAIPINRVQKIGAQAIVGTFMTVATSVAEAEATIPTVEDRLWKRVIKLWTDIHALPDTNPLRRNTSRMRKFRKKHRSPLYQVAEKLKGIAMEEMETIHPFTLPPWEESTNHHRQGNDEATGLKSSSIYRCKQLSTKWLGWTGYSN